MDRAKGPTGITERRGLISVLDGMVGRYGRAQAEGHRHIQSVTLQALANDADGASPLFCDVFHLILLCPPPKHWSLSTTGMSPFRQRPFKGVFQAYLFNGFSRIMSQMPYWIIPFGVSEYSWPRGVPYLVRQALTVAAYGVYSWGNTKFVCFCRRLRSTDGVQVRVLQLEARPPRAAAEGGRRPLVESHAWSI